MNRIFLVFGFVFMFSQLSVAQTPLPERSLVDDLLECSVFYETHGAMLARSNLSSQELWDKADAFKRRGIEESKITSSMTDQQIQTRMSYLIKKWTNKLLSVARVKHKQKHDIKLWTKFCNQLGDIENILPLN